ncbi:MAG TPA: NAD-dependent epimerase/dehydratase family protein [Oscillatoriaceae cyanobacterium]
MKALVTGGGGFLGGAIVRQLVARGDTVRSFARGAYPELEALGVGVLRGDLTDAAAVRRACEGMDVVFHVAAMAGVWGPREAFYAANVTGTAHVVAACRASGVRRLVFTSSPSVVFDGRDMAGVDESVPYPAHFEAPYPETKAIAERLALAANTPELATVALRPHVIWGPGDPNFTPRLVDRAKAGKLRRIDGPRKLVDGTYVDNAAEAHLLAADRLEPGSAIAGRAYFIANDEPIGIWELAEGILEACDAPPPTRSVSPTAARLAGAALEGLHRLLRLPGEPLMTRFLAQELTTSHWFDLTAAKRDLGYVPRVSTAEGLRRLAQASR